MGRISRVVLGIFFLLTLVSDGFAQTVRERLQTPDFRLYAVIFGIKVGTDSQLKSFRIAKVIDPKSGNTNPVKVDVPKDFVDAVRKKVEAKHYDPMMKNGEPVEFFSYFFFTPSRPGTVIIDLDKSLDQQP